MAPAVAGAMSAATTDAAARANRRIYEWSSVAAFCETHLPKAFFLFLFVPYFWVNAARVATVVPRSVLQALAALTSAASSAWTASCVFCETHLPKAFFLFLLVPYLSANAAWVSGVVPFSVVQALEASWEAASSSLAWAAACLDTHLPKAFFLFLFVPYFWVNAARVASVVPRSARHSFWAVAVAVDVLVELPSSAWATPARAIARIAVVRAVLRMPPRHGRRRKITPGMPARTSVLGRRAGSEPGGVARGEPGATADDRAPADAHAVREVADWAGVQPQPRDLHGDMALVGVSRRSAAPVWRARSARRASWPAAGSWPACRRAARRRRRPTCRRCRRWRRTGRRRRRR